MQNLLILLAALLAAWPAAAALAQPTAFRALYEAGKQAPGAALVRIEGREGVPQPSRWTFLYADPSARGGVREVVVRHGAVESVRTPLRGFAGVADLPPVHLDRLMVDSDRAFTLANQAAIRARIGFNSVDYRLEATADGEPFWLLALLPAPGTSPLGTVRVSAATGEVRTSGLWSREDTPWERVREDAAFLAEEAGREVAGWLQRAGQWLRDLPERLGF